MFFSNAWNINRFFDIIIHVYLLKKIKIFNDNNNFLMGQRKVIGNFQHFFLDFKKMCDTLMDSTKENYVVLVKMCFKSFSSSFCNPYIFGVSFNFFWFVYS